VVECKGKVCKDPLASRSCNWGSYPSRGAAISWPSSTSVGPAEVASTAPLPPLCSSPHPAESPSWEEGNTGNSGGTGDYRKEVEFKEK